MKTYIVTFWSKKTNKPIEKIKLDADDSFAIGLKAKVKASLNGFIFKNSKHYFTFIEKNNAE